MDKVYNLEGAVGVTGQAPVTRSREGVTGIKNYAFLRLPLQRNA